MVTATTSDPKVAALSLLQTLTQTAATIKGYKGKPAIGSGIKPLVEYALKQGLATPVTIPIIIPGLPGIFGGYPDNSHGHERVPSIIMMAFFGVLTLGAAFILFMNLSRRHNFFPLVGIILFTVMKIIGYALRYRWSFDVTQINIGIASVVFIQIAELVLLVMNTILAHRVFTWRHPETGTSWWINLFIDGIYFLIVGIIAMAIVGEALPFLYFMSEKHYHMCNRAMEAAGVLNLLYACVPYLFIFAAFLFPPGSLTAEPWRRKNVDRVIPPVAQANWIHSAGLFYYVPRGAQQIIYKDQPSAHAIRIIPSREPPANGLHEQHHEPMHPDSPRFSVAVLLVFTTTTLLAFSTAWRTATTFRSGPIGAGKQVFLPEKYFIMYIFYGGVEALVVTLLLLLRADLRFYIPDMARSAKHNPNPYNGSDYNEPKPLDGFVTPPERV